MSHPYRESADDRSLTRPRPKFFDQLIYSLRMFQFARRRIGGHWERQYLFFSDKKLAHWLQVAHEGWGPWILVAKCSEPSFPDTAGMPMYEECEDWGPRRKPW